MGKYFCFYVIVNSLVYLLELGNPGVLVEEIRNVQYVVGLFLVYVGYAIVVWFGMMEIEEWRDEGEDVILVLFNVFYADYLSL